MGGTAKPSQPVQPGRDEPMEPDLRVVVLAGGLSYEREVSLRSGRRILDSLRAQGVEATMRDVDATLLPNLIADRPDAVIIALHGGAGEDGSLQGILELAGVNYVGAGARSARLAWDKPSAKAVLTSAGVETPAWVTLPQDRFAEIGAKALLDQLVARLGLPLMVKPAQGGSGLGATVVRAPEELPAAMVASFAYHRTALVERCIEGVDLAVTIVDLGEGPAALPAVEIQARDGVYDYAARYTSGVTTWHTPARLPDGIATATAKAALEAHAALALGDLSRVDIIVDADGAPYVLEASVAPGMTDTSLTPMAMSAAGLDLGRTFATLARRASTRPRCFT